MKPLPNHSLTNLKKYYLLYFEAALIVSLAAFIILFKIDYNTAPHYQLMLSIPDQEILHLESIISVNQTITKPLSPPDVVVPNPPPEDKIIEEKLKNLELELSIPEPLPLPTDQKKNEIASTQDQVVIPEVQPRLIGGLAKLQQRVHYPPKAIKENIQGRVVIQFIIDKKGRVRNPKVVKSVRHDIDKEAILALSKSRFIPARLNGEKINIEQVIFIRFEIVKQS